MEERQSGQRALKRRGLIAGAAALVAGIAAARTSQPVAALDPNDVVLGIQGNVATTMTTVVNDAATTSAGPAIYGYRTKTAIGSASDFTDAGVIGATNIADAAGVFGNVTLAGGSAKGVHGTTNSGYGVYGDVIFGGTGIGVAGFSSSSFGVLGSSTSGTGAQGKITGSSAANTIGVWGSNTSTGSGAIGVRGDCTNGIGVFGTTSAAGQFGVIGQTLVDNAFGLAGIANGSGCAAFAGGTTNANSYAASFQGHVQVSGGAFDVFPMGNKHGLAQHPDGSYRTFYSVESPECWVEDFGEGTLAAGKAEIKLDADFAALVHTDHYHVFLTEHGEHNALHIASRTAGGFTVEADAGTLKAKGKAAASVTGTFSWRVVAKPKTSAKVERLAKATLAPKIDFSKLPKAP